MSYKFNPFTGTLDNIGPNQAGQPTSIPQLNADPVAPTAETAWVKRTVTGGGAGAGEPYGLLLALTQPGAGAGVAYAFSYRTLQGTTVRANLS